MAYRSELMIQVAPELEGPEDIDEIYKWVDSVPLSRMKKNINRDFADGVLVAELVNHYFPTLVEMHNYPAASSLRAKEENWATLNKKVFRKMGFQIHSKDVKGVCSASKGVIERVLCFMYAIIIIVIIFTFQLSMKLMSERILKLFNSRFESEI